MSSVSDFLSLSFVRIRNLFPNELDELQINLMSNLYIVPLVFRCKITIILFFLHITKGDEPGSSPR